MGVVFFTCAWILFHSCLASRNEAPKISNFYFPSRVLVGDQISALCFAGSSGSPKVFSWLKDGKDLSTASNVVIKIDKEFSVIIINPVSFSSSGNYTCVAENDYGNSLFTAQLNVVSPPKWTKKPLDLTVSVGKDIILDCAAEGLPTPKLNWKRIDETHNPEFTRHIVNLKSGVGTLILKAAGMEDTGEYECSAGNEVSSISSRIKIKVIASETEIC
ncbi:leucine-rich repeats and immunoglobulin-like domains protein 3 [Stegodyphus dumicola]|uniref:leucine-rich repeats and immunoglobulin-like domains protein 3 n=1 Tax=Stegodyphus dumicola TaxID=202533 RepID=UPI0015AD4D53|nr:leucine-rich repeats and immunoglobulin-like domains protein 3 [Stegodyphus dumicola]